MPDIHDDASEWFASQGQQIQDFEAPEAPELGPDLGAGALGEDQPDPDRPFGDAPTVTNDDVRNVMNMREIAKPTAEVIVTTLDVVIPLVIAFAIKGSDKDDAKLEPDEREGLVNAWATYLGDKNVQMSPGAALAVAMLTIYGSKVMTAITNRNERKQVIQQQAEIKALRQELEKRDAIEAMRKKREEASNG